MGRSRWATRLSRDAQDRSAYGGLLWIVALVFLGLYWRPILEGDWRWVTWNSLWGSLANLLWDSLGLVVLQLREALSLIKHEVLFNPVFYGLTAGILALEWWFPAQRKQPLFSIGLGQDFLWLLSTFFFKLLFLRPYLNFCGWFHEQAFHGVSLNLFDRAVLPAWSLWLLSILLTDFCAWLSHLIQHKVSFLWRIHMIHHSSIEMNFLTDMRFHFMSAMLDYPMIVLPTLFLGIPLPYTGSYLLFRNWYGRFYHANIRSDLGWLRYILVTPQSHRIHHSIEPHHYDQNFGVIWSIWDYLFRTQYRGYSEYPNTGIRDRSFPLEHHANVVSQLKTYWRQLLHPFIRKSSSGYGEHKF